MDISLTLRGGNAMKPFRGTENWPSQKCLLWLRAIQNNFLTNYDFFRGAWFKSKATCWVLGINKGFAKVIIFQSYSKNPAGSERLFYQLLSQCMGRPWIGKGSTWLGQNLVPRGCLGQKYSKMFEGILISLRECQPNYKLVISNLIKRIFKVF